MRLFPLLLAGAAALNLLACDAAGPATSALPESAGTDAIVIASPSFPARPRTRASDEGAPEGGFAGEILEAPIAVVDAAPSPSPVSTSPGGPRSDVLTAGDIDDGRNLAAFLRYANRTRGDTGLPLANLSAPILARLTGPDGRAAPGLRVTLRRPGAAEPFWDSYSGVDGVITVFPALFGAGGDRAAEMRVFPADGGEPFAETVVADGARASVALPFSGGWRPQFLDLVIAVDTTGSMGDELDWLTSDLAAVVQAAARRAPGVSIRYGLVLYKDEGDEYIVRNLGFTSSLSEMRSRIGAQYASGGGDYPEAMEQGLASAVALPWRRGQGERLLFLIGDAPPHEENARAFLSTVQTAAQAQVQVFGLAASGVAQEAEFLMRQAAVQTNGRYMFLTDDSGVGSGNAEPTVSCYRVTSLSGLMFRVIASELEGRRIEAPASEVQRSVGTYVGGICRD